LIRRMPPFPLRFTGLVSTFGGPRDPGMRSDEGLALIHYVRECPDVFLPGHNLNAVALGHWLDPRKFYIAMRWPKGFSYDTIRAKWAVMVAYRDAQFRAQPVDWGPGIGHRIADISPGLADALDVDTDKQQVVITIYDSVKAVTSGGVA